MKHATGTVIPFPLSTQAKTAQRLDEATSETHACLVLDARSHLREAEFIALVDSLTKNLHYAIMPIQTAILLARHKAGLQALE